MTKRAPDFDDARKVGEWTSPIVTPDQITDDERRMATAQNICGNCRFFELQQGQEEMAQTRFLDQLVREHEWQVRHLASPVNQLGVCGAASAGTRGESRMLTGFFNPECDQYRPARGLVKIRVKKDR
jgi:hypothetical protein